MKIFPRLMGVTALLSSAALTGAMVRPAQAGEWPSDANMTWVEQCKSYFEEEEDEFCEQTNNNYGSDEDRLSAALAYEAEEEARRARISEEAKDCFLTSACCATLGLPDNCYELRTLRHFRDRYLASAPGGQSDISLYYAIAPAVCVRLGSDRRRLLQLYYYYILPCAVMHTLGLDQLVRRHYSRMMKGVMSV